MSIEVYSECVIHSISNVGETIKYVRCLIDLRMHDVGDYALRAIDLNDKKLGIFNISLVRRDQYLFSKKVNQPDMIEQDNITYQVWLKSDMRDKFHQILRTCLEEFITVKDNVGKASLSSQKYVHEETNRFFEQLAKQENEPYYRNDEPFDCIICMETIDKNDGLLLHNCLHPLCKKCLFDTIKTSTEPTIKCPHDKCNMIVEERELRAVAKELNPGQKAVERLQDVGIRFVETQNKTRHCLTPDCNNWWFVEPHQENDLIYCSGCKHWICLSCTAVHEGQTCVEYKDMKLRKANENTVRDDIQHLEMMVRNKEAMYCPGCRAIIQKISGCDWLQCPQCKMELCWPTQGPRWGPKGRGDTSGGCRCRVDNGKPCVPNCGNCH